LSEQLERRVAQIVRDFTEAVWLAAEVRRKAESGDLDFAAVHRLVGDSEDSALFRLKEECHALFRFALDRPESELQAEELFDLAVGALFHEAMKFREGYYLTRTYGSRLERMVEAGTASPELADSFRRVFQSGRQRMRESQVELSQLFEETRDQLLHLLREFPRSGFVARSVLERPERTEGVLGLALDEVLTKVYGAPAVAYRLAVESLVEGGHYGDALDLLSRDDAKRAAAACGHAKSFAAGMDGFVKGDVGRAIGELERWIEAGMNGPASWRAAAVGALEALAGDADTGAERLLAALTRVSD
jgi:hypothetical protein